MRGGNRLKPERNAALIAAYRGGENLATVAHKFGMSESNAYRILVLYDETPLARRARA